MQGPPSWRRDPVGAGLKILGSRNKRALLQTLMRPGLMNLEVDEFEDLLRSSGCSEKMIEQEVRDFRQVKESQYKAEESLEGRISRRRQRQLDSEELNPYVQAELRRLAEGPDEESQHD